MESTVRKVDSRGEKKRPARDARRSDFVVLYRQAFAKYATQALWNKRLLDSPTQEDALVVARALRIEGDRGARRLAERIERACRAAH